MSVCNLDSLGQTLIVAGVLFILLYVGAGFILELQERGWIKVISPEPVRTDPRTWLERYEHLRASRSTIK